MYEVPELTEIAVVEGPKPPEPGQPVEPPPSTDPTPSFPVPIPIIKEEC
jgi:hypothetical protein